MIRKCVLNILILFKFDPLTNKSDFQTQLVYDMQIKKVLFPFVSQLVFYLFPT